MTTDEVMTLHEVAKLLRLNYWTVRDHAERGIIPAKRIGRAWRVSREELNTWLKTRETSG